MRFKQLEIGRRFSLPRENNANIYIKLNDNRYNNSKDCFGNYICSFHGCTEVKEVDYGL